MLAHTLPGHITFPGGFHRAPSHATERRRGRLPRRATTSHRIRSVVRHDVQRPEDLEQIVVEGLDAQLLQASSQRYPWTPI